MFIDLGYIAVGLACGIGYLSYLIGKNSEGLKRDEIIQLTIERLVDDGYIKHSLNEDNEIILHRYDD